VAIECHRGWASVRIKGGIVWLATRLWLGRTARGPETRQTEVT